MKIDPTFKPVLRGYSHEAMFFVSIGALSLLLSLTRTGLEIFSIVIYSLAVLCMFGISALYHRVNWSVENKALFKKLDHSAIFVMIAGTFTPVAMLGLPSSSMQILLGTIWAIAILGIVTSIWFINLPRIINAALYLFAGYMIAPYFGELADTIGQTNIILIALGGIFYSVGAVIYALKKPTISYIF